jgi:outer membrane protein assembly factor BamB
MTDTPTKSADRPNAPARPRPLFPGWIVRAIVAVALVVVVVCRVLPRLPDPPFPWNDQAFANLLGLGFALLGIMALWVWFCFFSGHGLGLRLVAFFGVLAAVLSFFAIFRLKEFSGTMVARFESRWQPTADERLGRIERARGANRIDFTPSDPLAFPQFLGPERSGWIPDPGLARDWTARPPKLLWKQPIGAGWSAFAASNGYAVTMEQRGDEEWISCYRIADGQAMWGQATEARHFQAMGGLGPRATPTISGGRVYSMGATGIVTCLDARGQLIWQVDLFARYGLTQTTAEAEVAWGRAGSPLVAGGLVIVPAGGVTDYYGTAKPKSLIALDAKTGSVKWEAGEDQISYASPTLKTLAGVRQVVIVNEKTVSGHDLETGRLLWTHDWPGDSSSSATSSQAVSIGTDRLLLTKGYGGGAELLELSAAKDGSLAVETVWKNPRVLHTKFTNVVVIGDYVHGLSDGILECVELDTGERQWKQGRYGHGQILGVGELILVQAEDGSVALLEASPDELIELTSFAAIEGKTWNNLCLYGKRLLVRNSEQAACYELP